MPSNRVAVLNSSNLPLMRRLLRFADQRRDLGLRQGLERARRFERLVEPLHAVAAVDDDRGRQAEGIVQALDGVAMLFCGIAPDAIGFIPSTAIPCSTSLGTTWWAKLRKLRVQDVERHLRGIEVELVLAPPPRACAGARPDPCGR